MITRTAKHMAIVREYLDIPLPYSDDYIWSHVKDSTTMHRIDFHLKLNALRRELYRAFPAWARWLVRWAAR